MANKKLIALLVAVATISTSMFAFLENTFRGVGRATETVVETPADIATGGETAERRRERWEENDADRRARRRAEKQERRQNRSNDYYDYR